MKNNILHHNRQSSFNSMRWVSSSTHTCPDHFCELQAAFCPRTICEYAHDEWECKVNSARQNRHGPFQNIKPFNNKLYSSCWISVRQKKTKRRKFICFFYSRNDGAKNSMESWKSRSMCGVRSFVYVFPLLHPSRTTLTKTHWIPKPIRLSTWILCVCVCASLCRLLQFRWMNFSSAFSSLFIPFHWNGIPNAINKQENRIPRRSLEIHSSDGSQKFLI